MKFYSGLPETACGVGSTLERTKHIRAELPALLKEFGVRSILDAPCGDCNWISRADLTVDYIGADYNPDRIAEGRLKWNKPLLVLDLRKDTLPLTDMLLCREFMQHVRNDEIFDALRNFWDSGIKWLLATNHDNDINDELSSGFRKVNLMKAPFNLPAPVRTVRDGDDHALALWHRDSVC